VDVAEHFTYLSQRGICWAIGLMDKLLMDIAFVIEGRSEDELPEAVLCCVHIEKMPVLSTIGEAALFAGINGSSSSNSLSRGNAGGDESGNDHPNSEKEGGSGASGSSMDSSSGHGASSGAGGLSEEKGSDNASN
jgi:hypothetical protein